MRDSANFDVFAHHGGTYSGLQVTLLHLLCGHLITEPASTPVTRISLLHFGHGMSYSTAFRTTSFGPSTIEGGVDTGQKLEQNDQVLAPASDKTPTTRTDV